MRMSQLAAAAEIGCRAASTPGRRSRHASVRATGMQSCCGAQVEHGGRLGALPGKDRRHAGLQDPGLLAGDGFQAASQECLVVEIDRA